MKKFFKIYGLLIHLNFTKLMTYRADFYNSLVANFCWSLFIIFSIVLLTTKASTVYGWSREELILVSAVYNIVVSIFYIFFSRNFREMSDTIHYGKLDAILMKPVDSQFLVTCMNIGFGSTIRMVVGSICISYLLIQMGIIITPLTILAFILMIFFSILILYSFWFTIMTLTIWFTNLENLVNLLYDSNHIARFPPEMYKGVSLLLYVLIFPLTLIMITPAKTLLLKATVTDFVLPIIFAGVMFYASRIFWKFALRYYTSASG